MGTILHQKIDKPVQIKVEFCADCHWIIPPRLLSISKSDEL